MELKEYFSRKKIDIDKFLISYIDSKEKENRYINRWTSDYSRRLKSFVTNGKTLRAGLVCLGHHIIKEDDSDDAIKAGAAVEMMQSALLIHDDIMDQDTLRRGMPTINAQYEELA
jgi:geranylgeranyl pyrophosphate synthase